MKRTLQAGAWVLVAALSGPAWAGGFDLPQVAYPADNAYTPDKAELGKLLFFDPRLSGSNVISCATCHNPALGWADGMAKGLGHMGAQLGRNTPTVINTAFYAEQFWDGRAPSLEAQAKGPIQSEAEMHQGAAALVAELKAIPGYARRFEQVFPGEGVTFDNVARAIAVYEREIVSGNSRFDRFQHGETAALDEASRRGWELFKGKARCASCHNGPNFSDNRFHNLGVDDGDKGRGAVTGKAREDGAFKTPTLRDVTRTAPYLHNGQEATLMGVMRYYNQGGARQPNELQPLGLTDADMADLVALMYALESPFRVVTLPELP
ncbi:MAG: cytochrome-c peroxidase [Nitrospirae bacterium]|nr:cytochrome-c peroxidase [Nitrospirota bacterium]